MDRLDAGRVQAAVDAARREGIDQDAGKLLRWSHAIFGPRLMLSTAFGKSGMVIMHQLKGHAPEVPIYFLETGYHFPETLAFFDRLRTEWGINLKKQFPAMNGREENLWERDPDRCCHLNKVEPFRALFGEQGKYQAWITGVRRDQASTRAQAEPIELLEGNLVKIQPLAHWTRQQVDDYLREHDVPAHPLFAQGYASIGCAPCTLPSGDSKDERAGRWAGKAKTECGLQTFWKKKAEGAAKASGEGELG